MLPLLPVFSPAALTAGMLNALLRREPWASGRLSRHAGKSLRFTVGSMRVGYTIEADGFLRVCDAAVVPDVSLTIASGHLADLPAILRSGDLNAITDNLHVQGDAALATLVSELARDLRWDIEEEFSARFGDVLGPAMLSGGRGAIGFAQAASQRVAANVAEYLGEEGRMFATRPALEVMAADAASLLRRLDALEQRVNRAVRAGRGA